MASQYNVSDSSSDGSDIYGASPTTVDDSDDDKHYYPPAPLPSKDSTGHGTARASSGTNRGLTRARSGTGHRAARAVRSQAISDSDMFGSSDTSPH